MFKDSRLPMVEGATDGDSTTKMNVIEQISWDKIYGQSPTDSYCLDEGLRSEIGEGTPFEHQILLSDRHLDPTFQYDHEEVDGLALVIDHVGGVRTPVLVLLYVDHDVLFEEAAQDRLGYHVGVEGFNAWGRKRYSSKICAAF